MSYANGRLPSSVLKPIPGGELRNDAADAWNDMRQYIGERHGVWIVPLGSRSSYRTYAEQLYFWNEYQAGRGNLAAYPGTSNHGWGTSVDVASTTMVYYIRLYGARFGWKKIEAWNEWWHYNYVGGYTRPKPPSPYRFNTKEERKHIQRLFYHRKGMRRQKKTGLGPKFYNHLRYARYHRTWLDRRAKLLTKLAKKQGNWKKYNRGKRRKVIRQVTTNGKRIR